MKNLLACLAILVAFNVTAQVDGFQLPYNPDAQPDGYIGAADVVELLTYYGQTFTPDGIYVNDDSTHVLMDMGSMTYPECEYTCQFTLPGSWRLSTSADLGAAWQAARDAQAWISQKDKDFAAAAYGSLSLYHAENNQYNTGAEFADLNEIRGCFCATQERPKVEYLVFDPFISNSTDDAVEFDSWLNEKAQEGWKLMPTPSGYGEPGTWVFLWRWAD